MGIYSGIKKDKKSIFDDIFEKVYSKLECSIMYVFLCGGNCKDPQNHQIRNVIKRKLEEFSNNTIKVLYPEELFFKNDGKSIADYFKDKDLLELETILANNSNIVCIICESIGSATELGAFTNYKEIDQNELIDKLVAVTFLEYEKDKPSFISEGPIKRLTHTKKKESQHKIYRYEKSTKPNEYDDIQNKLALELIDEFKKICRHNKKNSSARLFLQQEIPLKNFIGLAYLILLFIYFYKNITSAFLKPLLNNELQSLKIATNRNFDFYYRMAINFLLNNQKYIIVNKLDSNKSEYTLTTNGYDYIKKVLLNQLNIKKNDVSYIRKRIMYNQLYKEKSML